MRDRTSRSVFVSAKGVRERRRDVLQADDVRLSVCTHTEKMCSPRSPVRRQQRARRRRPLRCDRGRASALRAPRRRAGAVIPAASFRRRMPGAVTLTACALTVHVRAGPRPREARPQECSRRRRARHQHRRAGNELIVASRECLDGDASHAGHEKMRSTNTGAADECRQRKTSEDNRVVPARYEERDSRRPVALRHLSRARVRTKS
jgi:hypothetical protein